ncbi:molybdopterin molybdotransferase MoeA [Streptomyces sp. MUM 178J]|uniref:molybdopterin molybdotransferase MoeA n=1 Tax=Streptomyces sp. MUM 178J TaxID=2791991 RepID=UPI001F0387F8|nr:molybdopterin molybdotransferase MoeA [Streptomyces sp. MUM 178J]WRQ82429.1 molybdopterin molybdotransferase MoeA [Streptomyces sp. MUM 178J]
MTGNDHRNRADAGHGEGAEARDVRGDSAAPDAPEDAHDAARSVAHEAAQDVAEDVTRDAAQDVSQDIDGVADALALVGRNARQPGQPGRPGQQGLPGDAGRTGHTVQEQGHGAARGVPGGSGGHQATPWPDARALAARLGRSAPPRTRRTALDEALGQVLAEPLPALCDLPSFDTSAMDGWAVAGPGPWTVREGDSVLAGQDAGRAPALPDGSAVRIATGARIPHDATAVIRSEHARIGPGKRQLHALRPVVPGQDIRPRGQECRIGDQLLSAGVAVTPAVVGLAAAAGYDALPLVPRPRVEVLVLGDELLSSGLPHDGLIRDALGPMLGPWLRTLGAEVTAARRLGDDAEALHKAVTGSAADLVLTTGGTAAGPVDHVHPVLRKAGAELLVDSVAVRPGHPMLLARLAASGDAGGRARYLVGLPGNPLAAVSGLLTLAEPLLRGLAGRPASLPYSAPVRDAVHGHPYDTRLVPVVHRDDRLVPLHYNGPAMLRGIAGADGLAVVRPGGARPGDMLEVLDLPWTAGTGEGGCFT